MHLFNLFLMTPDPNNPGAGSTSTLIMMGLMILVFWLFMIRPQAKKARQQKDFINKLQKGDKIVTIAGIHGVVNKVNDDGTLMLETSPGSTIEKSAISLEWSAQINKATEPAK
jgi:preprotein translocase subunit YajC